MSDVVTEGGNVFKSKTGKELTQRINQADILPTVQWLEIVTGLDLTSDPDEDGIPAAWLGTTGRRPSSGDLDLAIDEKTVSKDTIFKKLTDWCIAHKLDPRDYVRKSGVNVHFRTPIAGNANNGFVQTDFMLGDPKWQKFAMQGGQEGSVYNGANKHVLLASIAKAHGLKWSFNQGLVSRASGNVVTRDPDEIAEYLLGPGSTRKDLSTVETVLAKIKNDPDYATLTADARETFGKEGKTLPESVQEGTPVWFRNMSNLFAK